MFSDIIEFYFNYMLQLFHENNHWNFEYFEFNFDFAANIILIKNHDVKKKSINKTFLYVLNKMNAFSSTNEKFIVEKKYHFLRNIQIRTICCKNDSKHFYRKKLTLSSSNLFHKIYLLSIKKTRCFLSQLAWCFHAENLFDMTTLNVKYILWSNF